MITKVWYVVINQGDGSCRVQFCESKKLAELFNSFDDECMDEAVGSLTVEHLDGYFHIEKMKTIDEAITEASEDIDKSWWDEDDQEKLDKLLNLKENMKENKYDCMERKT